MTYVPLPVAGAPDREVFVNPEQVVCLMDEGPRRTQVVTTGLSSSASITLVVGLAVAEVAQRLEAAAGPPPQARRPA
jgi:hypothetical protein